MLAFISRQSLIWVLLLISAWVFVFILRSVPLAGNWQPLEPQTFGFIALCLSAALAGGVLATSITSISVRPPEGYWPHAAAESQIRLLSTIALAGALGVIYEFAVRRGYGFSTPVEIIRVMEVNRAMKGSVPSAFSGAARLAAGAIASAWVLYFVAQTKVRWSTFAVLLVSTIAGFWLEARFMGGRLFIAGTWAASFAALVAGYAFHAQTGGKLSIRPLIGLLLAAVLIAGYFVFVFAERVAARGTDGQAVYEQYSKHFGGDLVVQEQPPLEAEEPKGEPATSAGGRQTAVENAIPDKMKTEALAESETPQPGAQAPAETTPTAGETIVAKPSKLKTAVSFLWVYATQGLNELDRLLQLDGIKPAYGAIQFGKIAQLLTVVTGKNWTYDMATNLPNPGLYWTMLGDTFVDFGYYGSILAAIIFGFLLTYSARLVLAGRMGPIALSFPFLMSLALFSPMLSLVQNLWPSIAWLVLSWAMVRGWQYWRTKQ